jgi:hypothetical protein
MLTVTELTLLLMATLTVSCFVMVAPVIGTMKSDVTQQPAMASAVKRSVSSRAFFIFVT